MPKPLPELLSVLCAFAATACGGDGDATNPLVASDASDATTAAPLDAGPSGDGAKPGDGGAIDAPLGHCDSDADLASCGTFDQAYCWHGVCLPPTACDGRPDGAMCDGVNAFPSLSSSFCAHQQCHPVKDFVVECWGLVPTCTNGQSYGVFSYSVSLASEASCPAEQCTRHAVTSELGSVLLSCGGTTPDACAASQLAADASATPGTQTGKVRCQTFSLQEPYCGDAGP